MTSSFGGFSWSPAVTRPVLRDLVRAYRLLIIGSVLETFVARGPACAGEPAWLAAPALFLDTPQARDGWRHLVSSSDADTDPDDGEIGGTTPVSYGCTKPRMDGVAQVAGVAVA